MIFILLKNLDIPMIYLDSQPGLNRKASNHERASDQSSTVLQQPAGNFGLAAAVCIDGKWSQFPLRSLPVVGPALGLGRAPAQIHPESMLTYCTNLHKSARHHNCNVAKCYKWRIKSHLYVPGLLASARRRPFFLASTQQTRVTREAQGIIGDCAQTSPCIQVIPSLLKSGFQRVLLCEQPLQGRQ